MGNLVWIGAVISLVGLCGIVWCIARVFRAKRRFAENDEALRGEIKAVLPWNLGALFLSVIGLMLVMVGGALS